MCVKSLSSMGRGVYKGFKAAGCPGSGSQMWVLGSLILSWCRSRDGKISLNAFPYRRRMAGLSVRIDRFCVQSHKAHDGEDGFSF